MPSPIFGKAASTPSGRANQREKGVDLKLKRDENDAKMIGRMVSKAARPITRLWKTWPSNRTRPFEDPLRPRRRNAILLPEDVMFGRAVCPELLPAFNQRAAPRGSVG